MIGDVVKRTNMPLLESELKAYLHMTNDDRNEMEGQLGFLMEKGEKKAVKAISNEDLIVLCEKYNLDPECVFWTGDPWDGFCYYKFPILWVIPVLNEEYFEMMDLGKKLNIYQEDMEKAIERGDYTRIIAFAHDRAKVLLFNKLYWLVPVGGRYEFWHDFYTTIDYGHTNIDANIIKDAFEHKPEKDKIALKRYLDHLEKGDYLTVYRGEGEHSTPHEESMSWTLSMTVAGFFATRYESRNGGRIYKGKIRKEHVLMYNDDRNEDEIVADPKHVENVELLPMVVLQDQWDWLQKEGLIDEYFLYKNTFIKADHYKNAEGIHGVHHVKRVLFHTIAIAKALGLSDSERAILANASIYHDIGRKHDGHCTMHGEWSWNYYVETIQPHLLMFAVNCTDRRNKGEEGYDIRPLTNDELKVVRFLMEFHCRDDKEAEKALGKMHFKRKSRVWYLFQVFKDCDGLDRVRLPLKELDVKYFRTEEAKNRLLFAFQVENYNSKL